MIYLNQVCSLLFLSLLTHGGSQKDTTIINDPYPAMVIAYEERRLKYSEMGKLALYCGKSGNVALADSVAKDYKTKYLDKISDSSYATFENVRFMANFPSLIHCKDRFFWIFYNDGPGAEKMADAHSGFARELVDYLITRDEITQYLYTNGMVLVKKPDWKMISGNIKKDFGKKKADQLITSAKLNFYQNSADWKMFSVLFDRRVRQTKLKPGSISWGETMLDDAWEMNVNAWSIFVGSSNKRVLRRALRWSNLAIGICTNKGIILQITDTKANLLYKLGKYEHAIATEEEALKLGPNSKAVRATLEKMKMKEPTWL